MNINSQNCAGQDLPQAVTFDKFPYECSYCLFLSESTIATNLFTGILSEMIGKV